MSNSPDLAPGVPLLQKCLKKGATDQQMRRFYQGAVFLVTFLVNVVYCMNQRAWPLVKSTLSTNCSWPSVMEGGCRPWAPFTGLDDDSQIFGWLDFTYLVSFSCSMLVSGYAAEFFDLRRFLFTGLVLMSIGTALMGLLRVLDIHFLSAFFVVQIFRGLTQATVMPAVIEVSGSWISRQYSGFFFGMWSVSKMIGRIAGNVVVGSVLEHNWSWAFFVPAVLMFFMAFLVYFFLIPHPSHVGIQISQSGSDDESPSENVSFLAILSRRNSKGTVTNEESSSYSPCRSCSSNVIEFAVCNFLIHVILEILYYWLPFMIYKRIHSSATAAYISSLFDVGSCIGAIAMGLSYDLVRTPALLTCVFLISSMPVMFYFGLSTDVESLLFLMVLSGCLLHGPVVIIATSVAQRKSSRDVRGIAFLFAVFDGVGKLGASPGPLLTGYLHEAGHWHRNVAFLGMSCFLAAALVLSGQCYVELRVTLWGKGGLTDEGEDAEEEVKLLKSVEEENDNDSEAEKNVSKLS